MFDVISTKRKALKDGLRSRERVFAAWTSLGDPQITEAFSQMNIGFVGIDIEHGTISYEQAQRIIAAAQANGTSCLPRIDSHSMPMIKRLLDSGADGVIVPMVDNCEQLEEIIRWVKYPPVGKRSFGVNRGQNYGHDFDKYTKTWNECSSLVIQIESVEGVSNIEKLLSYDAVDAVMVGPYDLSGSLGVPGELEHPEVLAASEKVLQAASKYGRGCGTQLVSPCLDSINNAFDCGYTFCVLSSDIFLLWKWSEEMNNLISSTSKERNVK